MRPAADGSSQDEKTISNGSSVSSSGGGSTVFLQQAAHLTHGMYYRLPKGAGMAGSSAGAGDGAEASAAAMLMYLNVRALKGERCAFTLTCAMFLWQLIFLPPPSLRSHIGLPSQDRVDFRAVCFCHQRVVDVGFVCSVCLSSESPMILRVYDQSESSPPPSLLLASTDMHNLQISFPDSIRAATQESTSIGSGVGDYRTAQGSHTWGHRIGWRWCQ